MSYTRYNIRVRTYTAGPVPQQPGSATVIVSILTADEFLDDSEAWPNLTGPPAFGRLAYSDDRSELAEPAPNGGALWLGRAMRVDTKAPPNEFGAVLAVGQEPLPGYESEFADWMDTEHIPALSSVDGTLWAARFEAITGSPRYCNIFYLAEAGVCSSDAWRKAGMTPWRDRLFNYTRNRIRWLFQPRPAGHRTRP
jgi:hypothetical protein